VPVNLVYVKLWGFNSDEDKSLIKNLQDSKGYRGGTAPKKTNKFPEKIGTKVNYHATSCISETNP